MHSTPFSTLSAFFRHLVGDDFSPLVEMLTGGPGERERFPSRGWRTFFEASMLQFRGLPRSESPLSLLYRRRQQPPTVFIYRSFTIGPPHFLRVREGVVAAWRNCIRRVAEGLWNNRKERPAFLFVLEVLGIAFRG